MPELCHRLERLETLRVVREGLTNFFFRVCHRMQTDGNVVEAIRDGNERAVLKTGKFAGLEPCQNRLENCDNLGAPATLVI